MSKLTSCQAMVYLNHGREEWTCGSEKGLVLDEDLGVAVCSAHVHELKAVAAKRVRALSPADPLVAVLTLRYLA